FSERGLHARRSQLLLFPWFDRGATLAQEPQGKKSQGQTKLDAFARTGRPHANLLFRMNTPAYGKNPFGRKWIKCGEEGSNGDFKGSLGKRRGQSVPRGR